MITHASERFYIGNFDTQLEAAEAYNKKAIELRGSLEPPRGRGRPPTGGDDPSPLSFNMSKVGTNAGHRVKGRPNQKLRVLAIAQANKKGRGRPAKRVMKFGVIRAGKHTERANPTSAFQVLEDSHLSGSPQPDVTSLTHFYYEGQYMSKVYRLSTDVEVLRCNDPVKFEWSCEICAANNKIPHKQLNTKSKFSKHMKQYHAKTLVEDWYTLLCDKSATCDECEIHFSRSDRAEEVTVQSDDIESVESESADMLDSDVDSEEFDDEAVDDDDDDDDEDDEDERSDASLTAHSLSIIPQMHEASKGDLRLQAMRRMGANKRSFPPQSHEVPDADTAAALSMLSMFSSQPQQHHQPQPQPQHQPQPQQQQQQQQQRPRRVQVSQPQHVVPQPHILHRMALQQPPPHTTGAHVSHTVAAHAHMMGQYATEGIFMNAPMMGYAQPPPQPTYYANTPQYTTQPTFVQMHQHHPNATPNETYLHLPSHSALLKS